MEVQYKGYHASVVCLSFAQVCYTVWELLYRTVRHEHSVTGL